MADEATTLDEGVSVGGEESLASALGEWAQDGARPPVEHPEAQGTDEGAQVASEPATSSNDGETEGAEASIESLDQLAEKLGASMEDVLGLKVKLKVDGEEHDATLADLIKINQLEGHVNRKSIELSDHQKAFEAEVQKTRGEWQQRVSMAGQFLDSQEAQIQAQAQQINWQQLAQQDPAQYSALYLQFQAAAQQVQAQKAQLAQHYQQTTQQMRDSLRPKALESIRAQHPELADPASYGNALGDIRGYLKGIGANESNFDAVELDPVVFNVAYDAARYRAIAAKRPEVTAKVESAPKFEKPSNRPSGNQHAKAIRDRAMRGDEDALAALFAV